MNLIPVNSDSRDLEASVRGPIRERLVETIAAVERSLTGADLPGRFYRKLERIKETIAEDDYNGAAVRALCEELSFDLIECLSEPMFLYVRSDRRHLYEQKTPLFGPEVAAAFPDSARDIAAAGRCLALDEWTACVFHLMRVLEHGLRSAAARFNVPFTVDSWHKVLKGIEEGLTALRNQQGLTEQDRADITKYSDIATEFRHFKDAWRNHVSHARTSYDEREAEQIWDHARSFMQKMAEGV